jgi:hypothetical protein
MSRKYVIAETSEASSFDWNQLVDIDEAHSRKSVDGTKIIARYEGATPSFLEGKTQYTHSEMLVITQTSEWNPPTP